MTTIYTWSSSADNFNGGAATGAASSTETAGSYGERLVWPATTSVAYQRIATSSLTSFGMRFIYTLASYASSSHAVTQGQSSGAAQQWRVDLGPTGLLRIRDTAGTQVAQGTQTLAVGTEYHFEVYRSGSTLTARVYQASNNALIDSISGTVGSTACTIFVIGNNATLTGTLGSFTYDEIVITDTAAEVGPPVSTNPLTATAVASPASSAPPYTLTLTITASGGTGAYTYAVNDWGDGTTSGSQSSNVFTKSIASGTAAGTKTISWTVTG